MGTPKVIDSGSNYYVIEHDDILYLQSYRTIVAARDKSGKFWLGDLWDCSTTTAKHVGFFVGEPASEIRRLIKSDVIRVVDLEVVR